MCAEIYSAVISILRNVIADIPDVNTELERQK